MTTPAQIEAAARAMRFIDSEAYAENWYHTLAEAALTAAAEVGMKDQLEKAVDRAAHRETIRATIERCAQVADEFFEATGWAHEISRRIRALKDKP